MENTAQILKDMLHAEVEASASAAARTLPLFLREQFDVRMLTVEQTDVLFAAPRGNRSFSDLRRQWEQLERCAKTPCVLCLEETTRYRRDRLIALGIPFILGRENLYLPFLGAVLQKKRAAQPPHIQKLTPIAQKMVLTAMYEKWQRVSCREISERMGVSRMTASRNLLELQALDLPLVETGGGAKYYAFGGTRRQLFELCSPYFQDPVAKIYALEEIPQGLDCLGGRSALSGRNGPADHRYPTFALTRGECRALRLEELPQCSLQDAACAVHALRYKIQMGRGIDPVSAILSVTQTEMPDARDRALMKRILDGVLLERQENFRNIRNP